MSAAALLSATVLVLALSLSNFAEVSYAQACNGTSCATCISIDGCGYCQDDTGSSTGCTPGTAAGPTTGECGGPDTLWSFSSCPDNCGAQGSCEDCRLSFPTCGWCKTNSKCMASYRAGECSDFVSTPSSDACTVVRTCPQIYSCYDCLTNTAYDCQWRPQIGACQAIPTDGNDDEDGPAWTQASSCPSYQSSEASRLFSVFSKRELLI